MAAKQPGPKEPRLKSGKPKAAGETVPKPRRKKNLDAGPVSPQLQAFGARIREARLAQNPRMSQERLAALCGYKSKSDISNIENGLSNPEFATIQKIAAALGLTVSLDLLPPSTQSPSKPKS